QALSAGLFALAIPAGTTDLGAIALARAAAGVGSLGPDALLALLALLMVAIAETGRVPIDNPDTHLELTMVHEGMLLEYSGRLLGILHWATQVKQMAIVALLVALFIPWGMGDPGDHSILALLVGLVAFAL